MHFCSVNSLLLIAAMLAFNSVSADTFSSDSDHHLTVHRPGHDKKATEIKYAGTITREGLHDRLAILTSDAFEGRETGTPGAVKAQHYIADQFKSFGLTAPVHGSYFFDVPLVKRSYKGSSISLGSHELPQNVFSYIPTRNTRGLSVNSKELLIIHIPASLDSLEKQLSTLDLTSRSILVIPEASNDTPANFKEWIKSSNKKLVLFMRKNPAIVLWVDDYQVSLEAQPAEKGDLYHSRGLSFHTAQQPALKDAVFIISKAGAENILKSAGSSLAKTSMLNSLPIDLSANLTFSEEPVEAADVLGYLPGTDLKNEVLVVSAHYDHLGTHDGKIYHGADDDGSGTSALLSIASSFCEAAKTGNRPRRSILFLSNVGEEKGLLGSQYYSEHPVFSAANTITDLNIDMIGRIDSAHMKDSDYVYVIGSGKLSSDLQKISEETNKTFANLTLDYRFDDPKDPNQFYYRSDHYNFAKLNIPIIFYFNGVHADYHQPTDVIEKINFGIYEKRARLVFYTAWELANRDKRPLVDRTNDFRR